MQLRRRRRLVAHAAPSRLDEPARRWQPSRNVRRERCCCATLGVRRPCRLSLATIFRAARRTMRPRSAAAVAAAAAPRFPGCVTTSGGTLSLTRPHRSRSGEQQQRDGAS